MQTLFLDGLGREPYVQIMSMKDDGSYSRLGSPYRTSLNHTEPYRAFASRIAPPLGIFEREPNRIGVPMLALENVWFE